MFEWVEKLQHKIKRFSQIVEVQCFTISGLAVGSEPARQLQGVAAEHAIQVNASDVDETVGMAMLM